MLAMDVIKNRIDFIPISQLKGLKFLVEKYQRGYKWEKDQIIDLLKDIDSHISGKYCLQPLIVKSSDDVIELIDGQQRITTIYLLIYFLAKERFFEIDYRTRTQTRVFLNDHLDKLDQINPENWDEFTAIQENKEFDNVDVFHFSLIYNEIKDWFKAKDERDREKFLEILTKDVHIIWYEADVNSSQTAEDIFLNLNAGKIPLTSSELIKALFILDIQRNQPNEIAKLKAFELANEWDRIENRLHEDSFWYFLCDNDIYNKYPTRIDLVIDLANGIKPSKKTEDSKEAYHHYEKLYSTKAPLNWEIVKKTFFKLEEWYNDKDTYHFIGFLINSKISSLRDLLDLSKGKNKLEFNNLLQKTIQIEFKKSVKKDPESTTKIYPYSFEYLDYEDYRTYCQTVLLLFNVEFFRVDTSSNRFPFDLYKTKNWSVEHINPQNPRDFKDLDTIVSWLSSFEKYFTTKGLEKKLSQKITDFKNKIIPFLDERERNNPKQIFAQLKESFETLAEEITINMDLHKIGNLCLLDRNTNSKLGNKVYLEKRAELLQLYLDPKDESVFIPVCTKDVFSKNFSKSDIAFTDQVFGLQDMEDYTSLIKEKLNNYYPKDNE